MKKLKQNTIAILILSLTLGFIGCRENKNSDKDANLTTLQEDEIIVTVEDEDYEKMDSDTSWANAKEDSILLDLGELLDSTNKFQKELKAETVLRVQGVASISWKGVSGCCSQSTVNKKAKKAIEAWVGQQMLANRPNQYYRSGLIGKVVSAKCSSKTDYWSGVRKCKGSWKQPYFIEFIKH
jgi:hypothetical protein